MTINVTQEHIKKGRPGYCSRCPVALAMEDAGVKNPWITALGIEAFVDGKWVIAPTPREVQQFIGQFDHGGTVSPFTFEAEL